MKTVKFLVAVLGIVMITKSNATAQTNFSGTWTFNAAKSDLGKLNPDMTAAKLIVISRENNGLQLTRTFGDNPPSVENYNADGSTPDTTINGFYHKTSTLKWGTDEKKFTILSKYHVTPDGKDPYDYTRTETYILSDDGKILTVNRITVLPDATQTSRALYEKN